MSSYYRAQEKLIKFDKSVLDSREAQRKILLMMSADAGEQLTKRSLKLLRQDTDSGAFFSTICSDDKREIAVSTGSIIRLTSLDAELGNERFNDIFYFCPPELRGEYLYAEVWLIKNLMPKMGELHILTDEFFELAKSY